MVQPCVRLDHLSRVRNRMSGRCVSTGSRRRLPSPSCRRPLLHVRDSNPPDPRLHFLHRHHALESISNAIKARLSSASFSLACHVGNPHLHSENTSTSSDHWAPNQRPALQDTAPRRALRDSPRTTAPIGIGHPPLWGWCQVSYQMDDDGDFLDVMDVVHPRSVSPRRAGGRRRRPT